MSGPTGDTQWPRYEVFQQDRPGRPHENTGTVHAPDAEMALQNARDVFVRRPDCHSLWVAPATAIFSRTAQELAEAGNEDNDAQVEEPGDESGVETYQVFNKTGQRRSMTFVTHVGQVTAVSPRQALQQALATFDQTDVYVWWVCPDRAISRSDVAQNDSLFAPARDKAYRMPNQYRTVLAMQRLKHSDNPDDDGGDIDDG